MNPRIDRGLLGVAILVVLLVGLLPADGVAAFRPSEQDGVGPAPASIVDPPVKGGGGGPTDGGDPDEVVIFIVSPGNPIIATEDSQSAQTVPVKISAAMAEIRALLFWAGVIR